MFVFIKSNFHQSVLNVGMTYSIFIIFIKLGSSTNILEGNPYKLSSESCKYDLSFTVLIQWPPTRIGVLNPIRTGIFKPTRAGIFEPIIRTGIFKLIRTGVFKTIRTGNFKPIRIKN